MSFRIPSLEEARKKQERASIPLPPPRRSGGGGSAATATAARRVATVAAGGTASSGGGGGGAGGGASSAKATTTKTIANPYAKRKKPSVAPHPSGPSALGRSGGGVDRAGGAPPPQRRRKRDDGGGGGGNAATTTPRTPPPSQPSSSSLRVVRSPVDVGPDATFSQAFETVEDTGHYERESAAVRAIGGGDDDDDAEDRAAQRTFEAAENENGSSSPRTISARDNQALLQPHVLHVSTKQRGNGLLRHVRNVPFAYSKMIPDYIMGPNRCALFLSCRYHSLHPNYIHGRIAELRSDFDLRVLLCLVDVEDNASTLLFLNKLAVTNDLTLILAWSEEEAARYLETYKAFEGKDASSIQRKEQTNFADKVSDVLCAVRGVNKTDSATLLSQFGSLKSLMGASVDELSLVPGMGEKKVRRLHDAFHRPFSTAATARRRREEAEAEARARAEEEKSKEEEERPTEDADDGAATERKEDETRTTVVDVA